LASGCEHIENYLQTDEVRDIAYVSFDVIPSKEDTLTAEDEINEAFQGFKSTNNPIQFTNLNSDVPYMATSYKKGDILNRYIDSVVFVADTGTVFGPYFEEGAYKLARLISNLSVADSVKVRHILIQPDGQKIADLTAAKRIADSLIVEIKKGVDFGAMVLAYSADKGSLPDTGKIDWFTESVNFVQPFKDACFNAKKGEIVKAETEFGVHIIEILDQTTPIKKVKVAFLEIAVEPGSKTFQAQYVKASEFQGLNQKSEDFEKAITEQKLIRRIAPNLTAATQVIPGLENSRELVRWTFNNKVKSISEVFEFGNRYIVATITDIKEKGYMPVEQVKELVRTELIKDKKADQIIAKLKDKDLKNIEALAGLLGTTVQEAQNISFASFQVPGVGFEPQAIATAVAMQPNTNSKPIKGKNGVYVLLNTSLTPAQDVKNVNLEADINRLKSDYMSRAGFQAYEALKKHADVFDLRAKFF